MSYLHLAEADLIAWRVQRRGLWFAARVSFGAVLGALVIGSLALLVISAPAQWDRLHYWYTAWNQGSAISRISHWNTVQWISPTRFLRDPRFVSVEVVAAPVMEPNTIYLPSIDIRAPIVWDVPLANTLDGLARGVVAARESVGPGELGRTFIVGHSSGYWWNSNPWTKVFALLPNTSPGDLVFVKTTDRVFAYKLTEREVVSPSDVQVVRDDSLTHNQLALMTCTPVGTTLNRLIVYAEPVPVL
ncbi:sortase [Candidatus Berkelbacteria bacterium]|nr:sortase [Candidatus Berkelbacteria bacterium]